MFLISLSDNYYQNFEMIDSKAFSLIFVHNNSEM